MGAAGISHWVEHMNFRGTKQYSSARLTRLLEEAGGNWNAYTFLDQTGYFQTVASHSLKEILRLEADRMAASLFEAKDVESERKILLSELRGTESNPRTLLEAEVTTAAFKLHPYRWPASGWVSDLESINHEQLLRHYQQYYGPNNAVLVLVGAFDTKAIRSLVEECFGRIPRKPDPPKLRVREPEPPGERRVKVVHEGRVAALQLAYRAPDILNDDFYAMLILDAVLVGAKGLNVWSTAWDLPAQKSSRLHQALAGKKLATEVQSQLVPTQGPYLYRLTMTLPDALQFQPAEEAAIEQLERLKIYELTDLELAKARNQLIAREFLDQDSVSKRAHQLGYFESIASYKILENLEQKISQVTKEDLRRVAIRYFADAARTVGWLVPVPRKPVIEVERLSGAAVRQPGLFPGELPGSRLFSRAALRPLLSPDSLAIHPASQPDKLLASRLVASLEARSQSEVAGSAGHHGDISIESSSSKPSTPQPSAGALNLEAARKTLANGVRVIVLENKFSPTVAIQASIKAGAMRESPSQAGLANLTVRMLERGTSSRNVFQLSEGFDFLGAQRSVEADYLLATVSVQGLSKDLPAFLQLLGEMFQTPAFPDSEFEDLQGLVLSELRERAENARWVAEQGLRERIYPPEHPFRRMVPGTPASVERIRAADVVNFYKRYYRPDQFVLSIAGDVQPNAVFDFVEKNFGRWTASGNPEPFAIAAAGAGLGAGDHWIELKGAPLCEIALGVPGISVRHPDYYPLLILNHIFGQAGFGGRLASRLRDGEGLAVSVHSQFDASVAEGPFVIRAAVDPSATARAIELMREEAGRIAKLGATPAEVASAKNALIQGWPVHLQSNAAVARQLIEVELHELGDDYLRQYPQLIAGVSMDRLLDCARTRFSFEQGALIVVGPSGRK